VIRAAGTDYAASVYQELGSVLQPDGITLNYQLVNSPGLVSGSRPGPVPLVASESSSDLGSVPLIDGATYIPVGFSAVAVLYNLPGVKGLRLTSKALADIYDGKVTRWNDRELRASNPGIRLPPTAITAVHRADASVQTELLTSFLAANSKRWRRSVGSGQAVNWPAGTSVSGDAGMQALISQAPGSIGYTSSVTALQLKLRTAVVRNPAGNYVAPTLAATTAVGAQPHPRDDLSLPTIDAPDSTAYPIAVESYAMTFRDPCQAGFSAPETRGVQRLLGYLVGGEGQGLIARFSFAPLPGGLRAEARAAVSRLRCDGLPL
jgi:phosphate transport system substrate-binding protein